MTEMRNVEFLVNIHELIATANEVVDHIEAFEKREDYADISAEDFHSTFEMTRDMIGLLTRVLMRQVEHNLQINDELHKILVILNKK